MSEGTVAESIEAAGIPMAALDFQGSPEAELLHLTLCQIATQGQVLATARVWVPLEGDSYAAGHNGHPMVQFTIVPLGSEEGVVVTEALGFIACARCHAPLMRHLTEAELIAIGPSLTDDIPTALAEELAPEALVAAIAPDQVAWAELCA